jgi:hypothetical protein
MSLNAADKQIRPSIVISLRGDLNTFLGSVG